MPSTETPGGRHRLVEPFRRPALLPRSANVVAATVGAVLVLGVQGRADAPAPPPPPEAPQLSALQPVVLGPDPRPAPVTVTGGTIAGAHLSATASVDGPAN